MTVSLAINLIRLDGGTQPRAEVNGPTVADYAEDMLAGASFPPVTVFYDGAHYWLADGFHRCLARKLRPGDSCVHLARFEDCRC